MGKAEPGMLKNLPTVLLMWYDVAWHVFNKMPRYHKDDYVMHPIGYSTLILFTPMSTTLHGFDSKRIQADRIQHIWSVDFQYSQ